MKKKSILIVILLFLTQSGFCQDGKIKVDLQSLKEKLNTIIIPNKSSNLPHRVICEPIKLANNISNEIQLEALIRSFLSSNEDSFGIDINNIKKRSIHKVGQVYYAEFYQVFDGIEVLNTEITFRVNENGNLFLFGLDYYKDISVPSFKPVSQVSLQDTLKSNFESKSRFDVEYQYGEEYILPTWEQGQLVYHPVRQFKVNDNDQISEIVLINLKDGTLEKSIHKCLFGNVKGGCSAHILPTIPTENQIARNLPFLSINVGGIQIFADENGEFDYNMQSATANLSTTLSGEYVSIQNFNGGDAKIEMEIDCEDDITLHWDDSNSSVSERNVYYHINRMHEYNKTIDSNFVGLDYPLQCIVNDNSAFCNAYWNGNNLHFNTQDATCAMNSAHGASVIYHEYGHAVNDRLYNQIGHPWGLKNPILHEAFSDIYSTLLLDDSRFALGWFGPGTMTRNLNNTNQFPINVVGQQHTDGLILGGAFWDLGQLTSPELAYRLSHLAKYGAPDDEDIAVAFAEVYLETLVADDDDGNLVNGTPNGDAIQTAFCNHGIGKDLLISQKLMHTPYPSINNIGEDYKISVNTPQLNLGDNYDHLTLVYSTDNFDSQSSIPMIEESDLEFVAYIPSMAPGSLVKYYFEIWDNDCSSTYYHPSQDYRCEYYSFLVGGFEITFEDNFELDFGWKLFDVTDNANAGRWEKGIPQAVINGIGQVVSPQGDNSDIGDQCLVTGASFGNIWYANDVDGGKTTVTSPVFSSIKETSVFEFYKWFTHGSGFIFPAQGQWKVQITNDGVNWVTVEQTNYGDHRHWIKGMYKFSDYVELTDQMQVRYEVSDFGQGSIVEGLIDDFKLYEYSESTGVDGDVFANQFDIYPNPAYDEIMIRMEGNLKEIDEITLCNVLGEKINIDTPATAGGILVLNIENLKRGVYILSLRQGASVFGRKVLVQ